MTPRRTTLVLSGHDATRLMTMREALPLVERAFADYARGRSRMPVKLYLDVPPWGDFRAMPAFQASPLAAGLKWVNAHPNNPQRGLPSVMATILLNDPKTGYPLAIMDGTAITTLRTGAGGGVAAKHLARRDADTVALVGCGVQAASQLEAIAAVRRLRSVRVWGRTRAEALGFCRRMRHLRLPMTVCDTIQACVHDTLIIVTTTPSRRPLVRRGWVRPGAHINAIGADAPGKQELDPAILRDAIVVVDDRAQASHAGEINVPIRRGQFRPSQIAASLGEVVAGRKVGRRRSSDITVFDSTGLAIQDLAVAFAVYRQALRRRIGLRVNWL
ncbi:MAG: ornithine cyclodeaminase family protein [Candidatus Omnitrophica bacterium]|nr:ornithine cyclodeaminase family protein [Candidatus Omnitrophota bacterium]